MKNSNGAIHEERNTVASLHVFSRDNFLEVDKVKIVNKLKKLDMHIKALQEEFKREKDILISSLNGADEVRNSRGFLLATYKDQKTDRFSRSKFEVDYPGVYDNYCEATYCKVFRLK